MRKKPKVGQIWYCNLSNAYFLITEIVDKGFKEDYDYCKIKWTDTQESDEVSAETLLKHENFSYII